MSNLYKQALQKGKPPKPSKEDMDEEEDDGNEQEELKDQMGDQFQDNFPQKKQHEQIAPIKPTQHFAPMQQQVQMGPPQQKKKLHDYSSMSWKDFYDEQWFTQNGTPVYRAGQDCPIFFCLHGAGDSAQSFACLAKEIKSFATLISFDYRGHGESQMQENIEDLSLETLIKDTEEVLVEVLIKYPQPTIIIVGHSMGGSIAAKFAEHIQQKQFSNRVQGLIVIDVVEGTAIDALPFMEQIVNNRPKNFKDLEQVIQWGIRSQTVRNLESARVSMPPKVVPQYNEKGELTGYRWKVDLMKSEKHWMSWFKGLTNSFLNVRIPKLLMLAEKDRMDKELTIAQMQGKFRLIVLHQVGHYMQEDDFLGTAKQLYEFATIFRIPICVEELENLQKVGIGKFHSALKVYNPKNQK